MINNTAKNIIKAMVLATLACVGVAEAQSVAGNVPESPQPIRELYDSYEKARFVVQVPVTKEVVDQLRPRLGRFWYLLLHTSRDDLERQKSPVMQFGFFKSRDEAAQFVEEMQGLLGNLKVVGIGPQEYQRIISAEPEEEAEYFWLSPADDVTRASLKELLEQAKAHYIDNNYQQALNYYLALSLSADSATSEWARELVGLSYERLGEIEQAQDVYRQLLADAPSSLGAPRVAQRLRALETAADDGAAALRASRYQGERDRPKVRGVFGQSYRYATQSQDNEASRDLLSVVSTNFDVHGSANMPGHEFEARLNGYVLYDEMYNSGTDNGTDSRTDSRIRHMNIRYTHTDTGLRVSGGRLRDFRTGVYTSFDGLTVQYPLLDKLSVGVNYGQPVLYADVYDDLDRRFFGLQANYEHSEQWQLAAYYTEQTLFGEADRQAYGGEVRYRGDRISGYLNLDYDYIFADFNNVLAGSTYRFEDGSYLTASYGRQRSPFLTAANVLIGQVDLDIEAHLRLQINRDNLLYDALQRTSISEFGSLVYNRELEENLDLSVDVYHSVMNEIPIFFQQQLESEGDAPPDPLGNNYINVLADERGSFRYSAVGVQLMAADFLGLDDSATVALRYSDTSSASTNSLRLSERLRFFDNRFFVTPKLGFDYTQRKETDYSQLRLRGSIAFNYRPFRNSELFVELGNELYNDLQMDIGNNTQYLFAGYSLRF